MNRWSFVSLLFVVSLAMHPVHAAGSQDEETLVQANRLLYSGAYVRTDEPSAMALYVQLLSSSDSQIVEHSLSGIASVMRLAIHYAASNDDLSWKLAEAVLEIEDDSLRKGIQSELTNYAVRMVELASDARSSGRCSTAMRYLGRAMRADTDNSEAKEIRSRIKANPGSLTVAAQPDGRVFINGRDMGMSPLLNAELTCGRYRVEVRTEGIESRKGYVSIRPRHASKIIWKMNAPEPLTPNPTPISQ